MNHLSRLSPLFVVCKRLEDGALDWVESRKRKTEMIMIPFLWFSCQSVSPFRRSGCRWEASSPPLQASPTETIDGKNGYSGCGLGLSGRNQLVFHWHEIQRRPSSFCVCACFFLSPEKCGCGFSTWCFVLFFVLFLLSHTVGALRTFGTTRLTRSTAAYRLCTRAECLKNRGADVRAKHAAVPSQRNRVKRRR